MQNTMKLILWLIIIAVIGGGIYYYLQNQAPVVLPADTVTATSSATSTATTTPIVDKTKSVIGTSAGGHDITAYHFGDGPKEVLFIGGIHGGYEWNTTLVAYQLMDYLQANPNAVPAGLTVTVIPVMNPDGLYKVVSTTDRFTAEQVPANEKDTIPGRFNDSNVDLNRNFDCDWQSTGTWQNTKVSGGSAAFSEPESAAIRDYVTAHTPVAAVVWYSSAGGVFASNCHGGVLPDTRTLLSTFSKASGYKASDSFDFYAITGDMVNWMAKQKIPAISVLLTNHKDTEWEKNQKGIDAILTALAK